MGGWVGEWMDGWMDGWMDWIGWIGWMDGWMDGWDGWMDARMYVCICLHVYACMHACMHACRCVLHGCFLAQLFAPFVQVGVDKPILEFLKIGDPNIVP